VSLLWRDEISIYVGPRKIALARRGRGLRPRVESATSLVVPNGQVGDIRPTLARLADVLSEPAWRDGEARVVVSDLWARYAIVPWPNSRLDDVGRLSHARYVLDDAFGDGLAEWNVTLSDPTPGRAYLACAMPGTLQAMLTDTLAPAGLTLKSLKPQLIVAFSAWRRKLPADDSWFVSMDEESLTAVRVVRGCWDRVHMARLSGDWTTELERLRTFGRLTRAAGSSGRMFIDAPTWMRAGMPIVAEDFEWLEHSTDAGEVHELALIQRAYA